MNAHAGYIAGVFCVALLAIVIELVRLAWRVHRRVDPDDTP